ncbi:MAG: hypothetical protein JW852_07015, partial [Spirochaetales bacterium]|nr:hypothetical protein [Spirochaetales bacterium]
IRCGDGVRPVRVLGREAEIIGSVVITSINQVYGNREKYILLEIEVEPRRAGEKISMAQIRVSYNNMMTQRRDEFSKYVTAGFTVDPNFAEENVDRPTMVSAVMQIAAEKSEEAMLLRDAGRIEEAKATVQANAVYLQSNAATLGSDDLAGYGEAMAAEAESIEDEEEWTAARKRMVEDQYEKASQQSY